MGNRAVIAFSEDPNSTAIYLHWNGGRASVEAFLQAAKAVGARDPINDNSYAVARLTQIIGNYFKGTTSIGVGRLCELDTHNGDNGLYLIGAEWEIIGRRHYKGSEETNTEKTADILAQCIAAFPVEA